jgi:hypothetical protein
VIAKRAVPAPDRGVRNMYFVVPVPKSKIRCHWVVPATSTQAEIVKSVRPSTMPPGSSTYRLGSPPLRAIALPAPGRPGVRVASAGVGVPRSIERPVGLGGVVSTMRPVIPPYHSKRA